MPKSIQKLAYFRALVAIAALLLTVAPVRVRAQSTTSAASIPDLDAFIAKALVQYRVPGAAVAVIQSGKVVLLKGYGVRSNDKPGVVDENTIFQIASLSKALTGALAATMVDAGKLDWDTPITTYLPEFVAFDPYTTRWMTMRDLLAQRTGWPKFSGDMLDSFGYGREEILRRFRYFEPTVSFREVAHYSNPGFFVAGEVDARVGGASWNTLLQQRVIDPLHMARTGTSVHDLADPNSAIGHAVVSGRTAPTAPNDQDTMGAAGSATSTVADLAHFMQALLGNGSDGKLLKRETVAQMFARSMVGDIEFTEMPPTTERTGLFYGLGFDSFDSAGHQIVGKAGALAGVRALMTLIPDKKLRHRDSCKSQRYRSIRTQRNEQQILARRSSTALLAARCVPSPACGFMARGTVCPTRRGSFCLPPDRQGASTSPGRPYHRPYTVYPRTATAGRCSTFCMRGTSRGAFHRTLAALC